MATTNNFFREGIWKLISYGIRQDTNDWNTVSTEDQKKLYLILKNMNLMLVCDDTLIESFSFLTSDIRRVVQGKDTMAIVVQHEAKETRYFRFRFAGAAFFSGEVMCTKCVGTLRHYVEVFQNSNTDVNLEQRQSGTISLAQHVSQILNRTSETALDKNKFRSMYPIEEIVKDCILDVDFPDIMSEIVDIISSKFQM